MSRCVWLATEPCNATDASRLSELDAASHVMVKELQACLGHGIRTPKSHYWCHIPAQIVRHGPMQQASCYPFEAAIQLCRRVTQSTIWSDRTLARMWLTCAEPIRSRAFRWGKGDWRFTNRCSMDCLEDESLRASIVRRYVHGGPRVEESAIEISRRATHGTTVVTSLLYRSGQLKPIGHDDVFSYRDGGGRTKFGWMRAAISVTLPNGDVRRELIAQPMYTTEPLLPRDNEIGGMQWLRECWTGHSNTRRNLSHRPQKFHYVALKDFIDSAVYVETRGVRGAWQDESVEGRIPESTRMYVADIQSRYTACHWPLLTNRFMSGPDATLRFERAAEGVHRYESATTATE